MSHFVTYLLVFWITGTVSARLSLTILHINDVNGRFDEISADTNGICMKQFHEHKCIGGTARVAAIVKKHRELHNKGLIPRVLFLITGNVFTGSIWFRIHKHNISRDVINKLLPDAVGIGTREFHYGPEGLIPYIEGINSDVPIVCTNLDVSKSSDLQRISKSVVIDVNGIKVGIMGYLTTSVDNNAYVGNVRIRDVIRSLTTEGSRLRNEGVMIIMAIGNANFELHRRIAEEVPDLNLVMGGGGGRRFLWNQKVSPSPEPKTKISGPYPIVVQQLLDKALLVTTQGLTRYIGRLNVTWDDNGKLMLFEGQPIFLDSNLPKDNVTHEILRKYERPVLAALKRTVAKSKVTLRASNRVCRTGECNFGNMVTDAFIDYAMKRLHTNYWTKAPIAIVPAGTTKSDIVAALTNNTISEAALMSALPFDQPLVMCSLDGHRLKQVIEYSVSVSHSDTSEGYLQFSGIRIVVDRKKREDRVLSIRVRCGDCQVPIYQDFDMKAIYNIVTIESLAREGIYGHDIFQMYHFNTEQFGVNDYDIIKNYLIENSPIYPQLEGRIAFNDSHESSPARRNCMEIIPIPLVLLLCSFLYFITVSSI